MCCLLTGDEVGGLIFTGRQVNGMPSASGSLTFDQFKQDQTVALQYVDQNGRRRAGLEIIDRPQTSLSVMAGLIEKHDAAATPDERAALTKQITAVGQQSMQRMFAGRDLEGRSSVVLSDVQGRPRLRLQVEPEGAARIQFLNTTGGVVREITP